MNQPSRSQPESYRQPSSDEVPPDLTPDQRPLFFEVLKLLSAEETGQHQISPQTLQSLIQVRARHSGAALSTEGLMDLLAVLLDVERNSDSEGQRKSRNNLLERVTQMLLSTPQSRARIDVIWMNLAGLAASS